MSRGIISASIAAVCAAGGAVLTVRSYEHLVADGAIGSSGLTGRQLDFTVAGLLLVGVALLIAGVIVAIAALAQVVFDRQDARDAALADRADRRSRLTTPLPPAVADTHPHRRVAH
ncbi:hypothetical protein [Frondihabitans australicus]|uniref:Uncharacterized protein n=1 Tax=Frondihabitans australicus TaxID=386892 RepID=A0A495IM52_9MICO|nr:hypothetical protein [Frondihabitans australicus]RKR76246.1 hypothetical protein C8E83_3411 [Frondihabitans australicus]